MSEQIVQHYDVAKAIEAQADVQFSELANLGLAAVHIDFKLQDIEQYLPVPRQHTQKFKTDNVGSFCEYLKAFESAGTACFIDAAGDATAVIDFGTNDQPLHKKHTAQLHHELTSQAEYVHGLFGAVCTPKKFIDKIDALRAYKEVDIFFGGETQPQLSIECYKNLKNLTIDKVGQTKQQQERLSTSTSTFESTTVKGDDDLPTTMEITHQRFEGIGRQTLLFHITYDTDGKNLQLTTAAINLSAVGNESRQMCKELLVNELKKHAIKAPVYLGTV